MKELLSDGAAMWQQYPAPSNSAVRPNSTSQLSVDSNMYRHNLVQASPGCSSAKQQDPFSLLQHTTLLDPEQAAHPRLQMPFHQTQNLTLPDKLLSGNQTQPIFLHDSSPQADWIKEAYNTIHNLKEKYLGDLQMVQRKAQEMRRRATTVETLAKADRIKGNAEKMMSFLNTSVSELLPMGREKVYNFMHHVMRQIQHYRAGNFLHAKQTPPVEPSFTHSEAAASHQRDNYHQIQSSRLPQNPFTFKIGSSMVNYNPMRPAAHQWAPPLRMLLHNPLGVSQHNTSHNPSMNIINSFDYSNAMPPQQDLGIKMQKMKQQMMIEKNKPQMFQKWNEDAKLRYPGGGSQRWNTVCPSPYAISPQQSSSLKDLSTKFFKSTIPASSSALPSPLTPSSNPADSVTSPLIEESSKIGKSPPQPLLPDKTPSQVSSDTQILTNSCLLRESTGDKHSKNFNGDASKYLVEVVKKISSSALKATLRDISAVTSLNDRIAGHFLNADPKKLIFHDLADEFRGGIPMSEHETGFDSRMKRKLDAEVVNDLMMTGMEFYVSGRMKRLKQQEANNQLLLKEIKEINNRLIEVVVDVMTVEDVFREGTLVRCSYIPIGFSSNIKTSNTSKLMFPNLLLDLIVSADYPDSSPIVSEKTPSCFSDGEEGKYLWMKAKSNFSLSVKKLSEPISVKDMAETWDISAREVFHDFAEQMGEGGFTYIYGKWENCVVAG